MVTEVAAMHRQIDHAYAHTAFFTTEVAEELADRLVAGAPEGLSGVYLVSGGSEAMETALKLARQYFVEGGESRRSVFIARRQSHHGNTLGALAVGGNEGRRQPFAPLLMDVARVAPCYAYRDRAEGQSVQQYTAALLDEIEAAILRAEPQNVIAFVPSRWWRHRRCDSADARLPAGAAPVRPLRHPVHCRRSHVRHGANRHHVRDRAGRGRRTSSPSPGPGRRLPADRRGAGARHRRTLAAAAPSCTGTLQRPPGGGGGGAGGAVIERDAPLAQVSSVAPRCGAWAGCSATMSTWVTRGRGLLMALSCRPRHQGAVASTNCTRR
jgi:hypothetical protein